MGSLYDAPTLHARWLPLRVIIIHGQALYATICNDITPRIKCPCSCCALCSRWCLVQFVPGHMGTGMHVVQLHVFIEYPIVTTRVCIHAFTERGHADMFMGGISCASQSTLHASTMIHALPKVRSSQEKRHAACGHDDAFMNGVDFPEFVFVAGLEYCVVSTKQKHSVWAWSCFHA